MNWWQWSLIGVGGAAATAGVFVGGYFMGSLKARRTLGVNKKEWRKLQAVKKAAAAAAAEAAEEN